MQILSEPDLYGERSITGYSTTAFDRSYKCFIKAVVLVLANGMNRTDKKGVIKSISFVCLRVDLYSYIASITVTQVMTTPK